MRGLTLLQPWAALVALGLKRLETRSWSTRYRGELAIHASARALSRREWRQVHPRILVALHAMGVRSTGQLPRGRILATCELVEVIPTDADAGTIPDTFARFLSPDEGLYGNYGPGRYVWALDKVRLLENPVAACGALGLWPINCTAADFQRHAHELAQRIELERDLDLHLVLPELFLYLAQSRARKAT